jgi:hypothetical protein
MKYAFIDGLQDHFDSALHRTVSEASNPQRSHLPICFGDVDAFDGLWPVRFVSELFVEFLYEAIPSIGTAVDVALGDPIDPGCVATRIAQHRIHARA